MFGRIIVQIPIIQGGTITQHEATIIPLQAVRDTQAHIVFTGAISKTLCKI